MKFKKILPQFLTLLFIVLVFGFFTMNAQVNMDNRGIEFGFGFLSQEASFDIQFSLIDYDGSRSYARLYTVAPVWNNFDVFFIALIIALIVIYFFNKFAKRKQEEEGKQYPKFLISLGIFIILPALTFIVGGVDLSWSFPELKQLAKTSFTYEGGLGIPPELIALTLALTLYTATFIAENVRAGIQGVGKGQKEAAASIGLTPSQVLKLIIMPQALRIIIPPTTNQYLNLTKNSSLAAAIAYPDLVLVFAGTAMMQTGRAIEIVAITMATYLTISLTISAFMNWYNKRIAIQEK